MQDHGIPCKIASVSTETSKAMGYVQGIHWYDCTLHYLKGTSHWRVRWAELKVNNPGIEILSFRIWFILRTNDYHMEVIFPRDQNMTSLESQGSKLGWASQNYTYWLTWQLFAFCYYYCYYYFVFPTLNFDRIDHQNWNFS